MFGIKIITIIYRRSDFTL